MIHQPASNAVERPWVDFSTMPRLDLECWREEYGVVAGITGAEGGFDLGLWSEGSSADIQARWQDFRNSFESKFTQVVVGHQCHGISIGVINGIDEGLLVKGDLDGHATDNPGILLTVMVADCVPVYLLEPQSKAIIILHAGWRGTAAGMLEAGLDQLKRMSLRTCSDFVMHCGVSVCGDCYEVGPEVIRATTGRITHSAEKLDLRSVLAKKAERLGVQKITTSPWCTVHDSERFHSYRSKGKGAGRMAAYLGVPLS